MANAKWDTSRHWRGWLVLIWLAACLFMLWYKWHAIHWFSLGDTDDNMRFLQVHDWIHGQSWWDLRQHRMDPPAGASIHWTRLVDLPIAAIIVTLRPLIGEYHANYVAVSAAPLIPLLVAIFGAGVTVRRLVSPDAAPLGAAVMLCGQTAMLMFMPLRIDHHNWQLACLIWTMAGIADPKRVRGGVTVGLSSAISMTIGLELLPYAAMAAAITALRWVWDRGEARRLIGFGAAFAAGCALGFAAFASNDNRQAVCDALSPVWLSVAAGGGGLCVAIAFLPAERRWLRLAAALAAGGAVVLFYVLAWPQCVTTHLERMSPELERLWFDNVREAKPIYAHPWRLGLDIIALPIAGLVGSCLAAWRNRHDARASIAWTASALFTLFAVLMLLWQVRAGPSAQILATAGATWLAWTYLPRLLAATTMPVRVLGTVFAFMALSGLWVYPFENLIPETPARPMAHAVKTANARCPTMPAMAQIEHFPQATILTFVDLGPRLIAMTHHIVIAGPYHRNGDAILDVQHAFRGSPAAAHAIIRRRAVDYVLICPGMSESTIYAAQAKRGFYSRLAQGEVPDWLKPVPLPKNSPFEMWRVAG